MITKDIKDIEALHEAVLTYDAPEVITIARRMFKSEMDFRLSPEAQAVMNSYHGDLTAAKENHYLWLPEMPIQMSDMTPESYGGHGWCVKINWRNMEWKDGYTARPPEEYSFVAYHEDPARALLLVDLKALIVIAKHKASRPAVESAK
jgi:hypothetical protein